MRRLLNQADARDNGGQGDQGESAPREATSSAASKSAARRDLAAEVRSARKETTQTASPVRPTPPDSTVAAGAPLTPQPRATQSAATVAAGIGGVEERLRAEEALEKLREKTAQSAKDFSDGKINRAQFTAMYTHFNEQRVIIERLLARDPDSSAWKQVAKGGQTTFLRQHFEARVLAYSIYPNTMTNPETPITANTSSPTTALPRETVGPILQALAVLLKTRGNNKVLKALNKPIGNGRFIAIIPGVYSSAIAMFSLEPSQEQFNRVVDMHRDFERANRLALERGVFNADQLVFPHRALFEQPGQAGQSGA